MKRKYVLRYVIDKPSLKFNDHSIECRVLAAKKIHFYKENFMVCSFLLFYHSDLLCILLVKSDGPTRLYVELFLKQKR